MVEQDDTIRRLVDGHNDLLEYMRKLVLLIPSADSFTSDMLPERIDISSAPPAAPEPEIVVPRGTSRSQEDEGHLFPDDELVTVSSDDTRPDALRRTAAELAEDLPKHHKLIGDSEEDADEATTGGNIEVEIINPGNDEQAKINHIVGADDVQMDETGQAQDDEPPGNCTFRILVGGFLIDFICDDKGHLKGLRTSS